MHTAQLDESIHKRIEVLCASGDQLCNSGDFDAGRAKYIEALKLVPEPHSRWQAATWIYVAIGDAHFKQANFEKTMRCFVNAMQCPGGLGNPFVHLRLGQAYFELGNLEKAADELARGYIPEGTKLFSEDDPKYLHFIKSRLTAPPNGWPQGW